MSPRADIVSHFLFFNFVARSKGCGVHRKLKIWAQILKKNEKYEKNEFYPGLRGAKKGGRDQMCFTMHFLCLQSKSFVDTSIFYFGISNCFVFAKEEFEKNFYYSRIKLIIWMQIWKIWLIRFFFFFVFFRVLETFLTLRTSKGHVTDLILWKINQPFNSVSRISGHTPFPKDMSRAFPNKVDNGAGFLGLNIERNPNTGFLNIMQRRLIKQVLEILSLDVGLQMESSPLPKESLLPNMCKENLPLVISTTAVWLECFCILLGCMDMKQWMILSAWKAELDMWLWLPIVLSCGSPNYNLRLLYLPWKLK